MRWHGVGPLSSGIIMIWPSRVRSVCLSVLVAGAFACSDDDSSATPPTSSTGGEPTTATATVTATSTSTGSSDSTAGSGGTADTSTGSGSSSGEPVDCGPYANETQLQSREVIITNGSDEAIFVTGVADCVEEYLSIDPVIADGVFPNPDGCNQTCEEHFEGACGCPAVCLTVFPVVIAPGAALTLPWSGAVFTTEPMPPEACFPDDFQCDPNTCSIGRQAMGSYEVSVRWGPVSAFPNMDCMCTPDMDGLCEVMTPQCGEAAMFSVNGTFDHPAPDDIELMI